MRLIVLGFCVLATACSSQASPTSPSSGILSTSLDPASASSVQAQGQHATELPFTGSITAREVGVLAPPNLLVDGTAEGSATHLGRYTATFTAVVTLATATATGSYTFTAANGDMLVATFTGVAVSPPPDVAVTETATVSSGTGRFANASGTFTIDRVFHQDTGIWTGSIQGQISLNR